ncbi:hypothetical protein OG21DRAFT_1508154 [Imleria badia]|nr:hypothetical protein OG21DRAFT_1508154 [Imleria badia]
MEAKFYYTGIPSAPVLVARSSTTPWAPTSPGEDQILKELRPIGTHPLKKVWEGSLANEFFALLDSMKVKWTSVDILRIGNTDDYVAPAVAWIGVMPGSLSGDGGVVVAHKCKEVLVKYGINDVDVEIRESVVWGSHASVS